MSQVPFLAELEGKERCGRCKDEGQPAREWGLAKGHCWYQKVGLGWTLALPRLLVSLTLPIPKPWSEDFTSAGLSFPNLKGGSEVLRVGCWGLVETTSVGAKCGQPVPQPRALP